MCVIRNIFVQPGQITDLTSPSRNNQKNIFLQTGYRQVGLDTASFIEPRCINRFSGWNSDIIGTNPVEHFFSITPLHHEFREGRHVEQRHFFPCRLMLSGRGFKPVLTCKTVFVSRFSSLWRKPVGAFPSTHFAKTRACFFQTIMQNGFTHSPAGFRLPERPVHGVKQA